MKTKLLSFLLLLLCSPASAFVMDGINYNVTSEENLEAEVGSNSGFSGEAVIRSEVEYNGKKYSVASIRNQAFSGCSGLTSVTIPNSVTSIGVAAFVSCYGLKSVHISDVAAWCSISFSNYYSNPLSYAAHLYLGEEEIKDLVIPNSATTIGESAFYGCSGLTSVTIPNSVTSIGGSAFRECSGLTSVTIPNSVTSIGRTALHGTGWYNNQPDGILYLDNWLIGYKGEKPTGNVVIAEGTRGLAGSAFSVCNGLTSVTIPNSVTNVGEYAFYDCSSLTSLTIPNSVTSIGEAAFWNCI